MSGSGRGRNGTSTSSFGVSRREGHDSSAFYSRFPAPEISEDSEVARPSCVDRLWVGDAREMDRYGHVADSSVALVVTSPPYFAGKEYEEAVGEGHVPAGYIDFLQMLHDVFAECVRKLEPGGRIAVNVANLGRKPYRSLSADVIRILQDDLKLLLRGEVIWQKAKGSAGSCAWGSYRLPGNPVLRDLTERVVIASKGRFDRALARKVRAARQHPSDVDARADEFVEATTDLWEIRPASATRVGHPAPFPVELPERLIELYTYRGDLILDPFMGSGTTAVAAVRSGRRFVGFDTDADYIALAKRRVATERASLARRNGETEHFVGNGDGFPANSAEAVHVSRNGDEPEGAIVDDFQARAVLEGRKARELAKEILSAGGFSSIRERVRFSCGVEVNFEARDRGGEQWRFDVSGAFSITKRPGLRRTDTLWKAIGKASTLYWAERETGVRPVPLVLLTTDRPARNSSGDKALGAVTGPGRPIRDVIQMTDAGDRNRLADLSHGDSAENSTEAGDCNGD